VNGGALIPKVSIFIKIFPLLLHKKIPPVITSGIPFKIY